VILEAAAAGMTVGAGVWLVYRGASPPPKPLNVALADLHRPRWSNLDEVSEKPDTPMERMAAKVAGVLDSEATHRRLVLVGRTPHRHALDKVIYATFGAVLPFLVAFALVAGGAPVGIAPTLVAAAGLGTAGFLYPGIALRTEADRTRRDLTAQLALYLDLVVVLLAGGRGVDGALTAAAQQSNAAAFRRVRRTLAAAQLFRESPWRALDRLATELDLAPLAELAASVTLAGESGAKVRDSLAVKAQSIRSTLLAEAEAEAHRRSEAMSAPVVMMLGGFMLLIGFPATYALLTF